MTFYRYETYVLDTYVYVTIIHTNILVSTPLCKRSSVRAHNRDKINRMSKLLRIAFASTIFFGSGPYRFNWTYVCIYQASEALALLAIYLNIYIFVLREPSQKIKCYICIYICMYAVVYATQFLIFTFENHPGTHTGYSKLLPSGQLLSIICGK